MSLFTTEPRIWPHAQTRGPGDWIQTWSGAAFWPLDPSPEDVRLVDIAHALSQVTRYQGHLDRFYSVAEHSVLVMEAVRRLGAGRDVALAALMHDAAEAYLADLSRPIKRMPAFAFFRDIEQKILDAIFQAFNIPALSAEDQAMLDHVDVQMTHVETEQLMRSRSGDWGLPPRDDTLLDPITIRADTPVVAEERFLSAFDSLRNQ